MVAVPLSSGQSLNAHAMADTGAGLALDGGSAAVGAMATAVRAMLRSQDYRTRGGGGRRGDRGAPAGRGRARAPSLTSA